MFRQWSIVLRIAALPHTLSNEHYRYARNQKESTRCDDGLTIQDETCPNWVSYLQSKTPEM